MQSMARSISIDVCDYTDKPLCNLYDSANQISGQAVNVVTHTERNGYKEIRFNIPSMCEGENGLEENYRLQYLISDYRIKLQIKKPGKPIETDWFLISENKVTHNAFSKEYEVHAKHISQLLTTKNLDLEFTDDDGNNVGTIKQLAEVILEGTNWHLGEVAEFLEEEKYSQGEEVEKKRSFTAAAKTGAFKMMNDLCELFKAKAVYHGAGEYQSYRIEGRNPEHVVATYGTGYDEFEARKAISNAQDEGWTNLSAIEDSILIGRTVDILPLNPFSDKLEEGQIPAEVLKEKKVIELHYDKNIKSITRTLNTENLITKLSAYGAAGDYETGFCSLQTAVHKELTFNITLQANQEYEFTYLNSKYYFTPSETITNGKWSYLDFVSRSYIYYYSNDEFKICKVYKTPNTLNYILIEDTDYTIEEVINQIPYVMDFSYYQKVGLLTDQMLYDLAVSQISLPQKYTNSQEASLDLSDTFNKLMRTTSDGNGFAKLSVIPSASRDNSVVLGLDVSNYPDGVIYRSDYNESSRKYFSWRPAVGFKDNGEAISAIGSVVYGIKQGSGNTATRWVKAYLKAVGRDNYFYYRDNVETIYKITSEAHYDKKQREESDDPLTITEFPVVGQSGVLYVADKEFKSYVWNNGYVEAFACNYVYGVDKFESPTKIMLWSNDESFFSNADCVYLFSSDSLAGIFGPREDEMNSNAESLLKARRLTTELCSLDFIYAEHNQPYVVPSSSVAQQNYGWYYVIYPEINSTNRLFFCWGKSDGGGDSGWSEVYISYGNENPESNPDVSPTSITYGYYYNIRRKMLYKADSVNNKWIAIKDTVDKNDLTAHFASVIAGCQRQERLYKGLAEVYSHTITNTLPQGNYALKNEFNTYWLFTTNKTLSSGEIKYKVGDKMIWQTNDIDDTVRCVERTFDILTFPSSNDLEGITFNSQTFDPSNNTFTTGEENKISNNVSAYEKITYKCNLPADSYVVYLDTNARVLNKIHFQNSTFSTAGTFTTPSHTTHIRVVCPGSTASFDNCKVYVDGYENKVFSNDVMYTILTTTSSSNRDGISDLMDQFINLSEEAFFVKLPALRRSQQEVKDINTNLMNELGDMYREGRWQNNDYVEGDEFKLYTDALDNIHEVAYPEATYDISYIDLYKMQNGVGLSIDESYETVDYPDIDISYAAHLIDQDLDTNCWAYIDMTEICHDKPWESTIEINTKLSMIGQQSFTDVLARIAEVANIVKANETIYKRASVLTGSGKLAADRLEGAINLNKTQILGGTSNWYTDEKGNIVFESSDGESAMMLTGKGWAISQEKNVNGEWVWRYMASGKGLTADAIYTGYLSGERIEAGSITTDKISASVGQELDIGSNAALNLYATVDGTRPAGYLVTKHPDPGDSWISIGPKTLDHDAYIDIKSGGLINVEAGSIMKIASHGIFQVESGGDFLVTSPNFTVSKDLSGNYSVMTKGQIIAESGNIAGFTVDGTLNNQGQYTKQWMYAGSTTSIDSIAAGVYLGTDGINIGGKMVYKINDESLNIKATSVLIGDENSSYIKLLNNSFSMNASANITLSADSTISVSSGQNLSLTTAGTVKIGNSSKAFTIGTNGTSNAYISSDARTTYNDTSKAGVYVGTDGISLGRTGSGTEASPYVIPFTVTRAGALKATNADITGTITANDGKIANWYIKSTFIADAETIQTSTTGLGHSTIAYWAGKENNQTDLATSKFYVRTNGTMVATSATVKGTVKATSLYVGATDSSNGTLLKLSNNFVVSNSVSDVGATIKTTAGIKVATNGVVISSATTNAATAIRSDAGISVDSTTGVVISATGSTGSTSATKISKLSLNNEKIAISCTDVGTSNAGVYITPTSITVGASGSINLSAASVTLNYSQLSNKPDIFTVPTGITIANKELKVYSGNSNYIHILAKNTSGQNGIYAKGTEIKLDAASGTNHVYITSSGIDIKGERITINDKPVWARDDIIIAGGDTPPSPNPGHDWVWIKPFYNATASYTNSTTVTSPSGGTMVKLDSAYFGDGASWYKYTLKIKSFTAKTRGSAATYTTELRFGFANSQLSGYASGSIKFTGTGTHGGYSIDVNDNGEPHGTNWNTISGTGITVESRGSSPVNLCTEGGTVYFYVDLAYGRGINSLTFELICECDIATSRVPCTVYYYP